MITALVFALAFAALYLLMLGERMGLPADWAVAGSHGIIAIAALAIALFNMTSRLGRFMIGHERGARLSATALAATLLLTGLLLFRQSATPLPQLLALFFGWALALASVGTLPWRNFRHPPSDPADRDPLAGGSGAGRVAGFAVLVILLAVALYLSDMSRLTWQPILLAQTGGSLAGLAVVTAALLVLGGMAGLGRLALIALTLALAAAVMPAMTALIAEAARLPEVVTGWLREVSALKPAAVTNWLKSVDSLPVLVALFAGFAFGSASGQALAVVPGRLMRFLCASVAALMAGLFMGLIWLSDVTMIKGLTVQLQAQPPSQWPPFVFEPALRGWVRACGVPVEDGLAAALACGTGTARTLLSPDALTFEPGLGRPALAVSLGWPVLAGHIWVVLPAWLSLIGFLALIQACATGLSERLAFRLLRPRCLRSTRLVFARIAILALALLLFGKEWGWGQVPEQSLFWLMMGGSFLLLVSLFVRATEGVVRFRRGRRPVQAAPAAPTPLEAS